MKYVLIASYIILLGLGAYPGFLTGKHVQRHADELEAVSADAGHYNQKSAGFEWGSPSESHIIKLNLDEAFPEIKPAHKPAVHP